MATIVFSILTWVVLGELPDTKTIICILLAVIIIVLQLSNIVKV